MNNKQMQNVTTGSIYLPQNQSNINKTRCKSIYIYSLHATQTKIEWTGKRKGKERKEYQRERESVLPVGDGGGVRCGFGLKVSGGLERRRFLVVCMGYYGVNECTSTCVCGLCFLPLFFVTLPFGLLCFFII